MEQASVHDFTTSITRWCREMTARDSLGRSISPADGRTVRSICTTLAQATDASDGQSKNKSWFQQHVWPAALKELEEARVQAEAARVQAETADEKKRDKRSQG